MRSCWKKLSAKEANITIVRSLGKQGPSPQGKPSHTRNSLPKGSGRMAKPTKHAHSSLHSPCASILFHYLASWQWIRSFTVDSWAFEMIKRPLSLSSLPSAMCGPCLCVVHDCHHGAKRDIQKHARRSKQNPKATKSPPKQKRTTDSCLKSKLICMTMLLLLFPVHMRKYE